jgi:polysaccharide biosynthesis transport protein
MEIPEPASFADDLQRYFNILWRRAWIILVTIVVAGFIVYILNRQSTPVYQATTTVLINEAPSTKTTDYTAIVTSERLAQTYSQLMSKKPVLEGVIEQLDIEIQAEDMLENLFIQPIRDTTLIEVRYEDVDPKRAALITNAIVTVFSTQNQQLQASRYASSKSSLETQLNQMDDQIQRVSSVLSSLEENEDNQAERDRLETNLNQYRQTYAYLLQSYEQVRLVEAQSTSNIVQVEPASIPEKPIRPRTLTNTILAVVIGMFMAIGGIFLYESIDDTLKGPDEITAQVGLPVLGIITRHEIDESKPITLLEPRSPVSESFRALRTNIQYASVNRPLKTLLITSPTPAEGKTTISVNLGIVMAQSDRNVVIIDADLRRPKIHKALGLPNQKGLSDLFVDDGLTINGSLKKTEIYNLRALVAGNLPPNPSELLGSEKMQIILEKINLEANLIIVDSPPVMAVTDPAVLAPKVDGVLLVVKPGVTQMAVLKQSVELLRRGDVKILGFVLNEVDMKKRGNYYYRGYYYASHYYDNGNEKAGSMKNFLVKWWKKIR